MSEKQILLIGGGGHCRSCIDVIESNNSFEVAGIVEQSGQNRAKTILDYPVIGYDDELETLKKKYDYAVVTVGQIGTSNIRQKLFNRLKKIGFNLPVVISQFAHVSRFARIEEGTIVMHRCVVNAGAQIGENCILNTGCIVEHDVHVGDHSHISTGSILNGGSLVGEGCFVGSNATVVHGVSLPEHYFFKAGSLILSAVDGRPVTDKKI